MSSPSVADFIQSGNYRTMLRISLSSLASAAVRSAPCDGPRHWSRSSGRWAASAGPGRASWPPAAGPIGPGSTCRRRAWASSACSNAADRSGCRSWPGGRAWWRPWPAGSCASSRRRASSSRRTDGSDGRAVVVSITAKGRDAYRRLRAASVAAASDALAGVEGERADRAGPPARPHGRRLRRGTAVSERRSGRGRHRRRSGHRSFDRPRAGPRGLRRRGRGPARRLPRRGRAASSTRLGVPWRSPCPPTPATSCSAGRWSSGRSSTSVDSTSS